MRVPGAARIRSFGIVISIGFILTVSLVVSAGLSAVDAWLGRTLPAAPLLLEFLNAVVSLSVITLLFTMVYRILPDVRLRWRDGWIGALITAALFTVGKELIGRYLGRSATASTFGVAGSIVILMLWVNYSSQIVLLGAKITRVYVRMHRSSPAPEPHAEKATPLRKPRPVHQSP